MAIEIFLQGQVFNHMRKEVLPITDNDDDRNNPQNPCGKTLGKLLRS